MSKEITDETVSSRPFTIADEADVISLQERIDKIDFAIANLDEMAIALGEDKNWQIISKELHKRLIGIVMGFFAKNNPSDPAVQVKFAVAWGQFNEVLALTEREVGVKSQIQRLKTEKKSVMETMKTIIEKVFSKNEKEK